MASAIQRLLVLYALIAAGIAFAAPAAVNEAPRHPARADIAAAIHPGADKATAIHAGKKTPCARNAGRSRPCPVCSKSIVLRSINRTRTKMPGKKPRAVTGVLMYEQLAVTAELTSTSLSLARLSFQHLDLASGEVLTRTGRLRI